MLPLFCVFVYCIRDVIYLLQKYFIKQGWKEKKITYLYYRSLYFYFIPSINCDGRHTMWDVHTNQLSAAKSAVTFEAFNLFKL